MKTLWWLAFWLGVGCAAGQYAVLATAVAVPMPGRVMVLALLGTSGAAALLFSAAAVASFQRPRLWLCLRRTATTLSVLWGLSVCAVFPLCAGIPVELPAFHQPHRAYLLAIAFLLSWLPYEIARLAMRNDAVPATHPATGLDTPLGRLVLHMQRFRLLRWGRRRTGRTH